MAKIIDKLKEQLTEDILTETEIDAVMEKEKYYPIEGDAEQEDSVLKYSNGKSEIWVKCIYSDGELEMSINVQSNLPQISETTLILQPA